MSWEKVFPLSHLNYSAKMMLAKILGVLQCFFLSGMVILEVNWGGFGSFPLVHSSDL